MVWLAASPQANADCTGSGGHLISDPKHMFGSRFHRNLRYYYLRRKEQARVMMTSGLALILIVF